MDAQHEFFIESDSLKNSYQQFMRSELQRTVSALCGAVQQVRAESQASLAAPFNNNTPQAAVNNKQTAGALDQDAKQVLHRRKTKWPVLQRTVFSNGIGL